ncbi:hypothetical protein AB0P15_36160 [Streptomyces sp. NPDC087917]|uniref:hypothetical protein n=1 Tax=Streptomyces sp. NPDC087917 TaxID=3155060 RepID=UPI0034372249
MTPQQASTSLQLRISLASNSTFRQLEQTPWTAARREAYANDQNSPDTLIAVSAASNRPKSDNDPAE